MMRATLQALALALAFALILGAFGPSLDARTYSDYGYRSPTVDAGEVALLEAQARHRCTAARGENAGAVIVADGAVVCTDKHGRKPRNQITIAHKVTP